MPDLLQPQPPPSWRERIAELPVLVTPIRIVAAVVAAVAIAVLGFLFLRTPPPPSELILPRADASASPAGPGGAGDGGAPAGAGPTAPGSTVGPGPGGAATGTPGPGGAGVITVHAAGQVAAPGVYSVPAGARVADVVTAAGGLAAEADVDSLNLAAKVADGSRIYVPRKGEQVPAAGGGPVGGASDPTGAGGGPSGGAGGPVDLNSATAEQLDTLPGVGPATAAAILTYRTRHGRFKTVTELLEVPGIGPSKLEALRPLVTVG